VRAYAFPAGYLPRCYPSGMDSRRSSQSPGSQSLRSSLRGSGIVSRRSSQSPGSQSLRFIPPLLRKALQEIEPGPPPVSQSIRFLPPALRIHLRGLLRGPALSLLPFRCVLRYCPCGKGVVSPSLRSSKTSVVSVTHSACLSSLCSGLAVQ